MITSHFSSVSPIDKYMDAFFWLIDGLNQECLLKGNILLNTILKDTARSTKDLDMSVLSMELYTTVIKPKLEVMGRNAVNAGLAEAYLVKEITQTSSGGIKFTNAEQDAFSIDISLANMNAFGVKTYEFHGKEFLGSSLEKIVADKLSVALSSRKFRRVKDFYDLHIIVKAQLEIDYYKVVDLIASSKGIDYVVNMLDEFPYSQDDLVKLYHAWDKLELKSFSDQIQLVKPTMSVIIEEVSDIYERFREAVFSSLPR